MYLAKVALWFCPGLVDRFELTFGPLLECRRANITKIAVTTFAIAEMFNIIKHIGFMRPCQAQ